jgi:hypothetical protein
VVLTSLEDSNTSASAFTYITLLLMCFIVVGYVSSHALARPPTRTCCVTH